MPSFDAMHHQPPSTSPSTPCTDATHSRPHDRRPALPPSSPPSPCVPAAGGHRAPLLGTASSATSLLAPPQRLVRSPRPPHAVQRLGARPSAVPMDTQSFWST
ncbi:hypothetical protein VPH35_037525 [Triticum aestivum]